MIIGQESFGSDSLYIPEVDSSVFYFLQNYMYSSFSSIFYTVQLQVTLSSSVFFLKILYTVAQTPSSIFYFLFSKYLRDRHFPVAIDHLGQVLDL